MFEACKPVQEGANAAVGGVGVLERSVPLSMDHPGLSYQSLLGQSTCQANGRPSLATPSGARRDSVVGECAGVKRTDVDTG
eukprot:2194007-Pyramimonas_sp.AAC.1